MYADVAKCLADGVVLLRSANNVILCPGLGDEVPEGRGTLGVARGIPGRIWGSWECWYGMVGFGSVGSGWARPPTRCPSCRLTLPMTSLETEPYLPTIPTLQLSPLNTCPLRQPLTPLQGCLPPEYFTWVEDAKTGDVLMGSRPA